MNMTLPYPSSVISSGKELSKLLSAAVVNQRFCKLLLTNPAKALDSGYYGETFRLSTEVKDLVVSIQAKNLAEFARQLNNERDNSIEITTSRTSKWNSRRQKS